MNTANKNTYKRRLLSVLGAFFLVSYSLAPVYASDTEVYAREQAWDGNLTPVLMMVLDSSGSMNGCLENCSSTSSQVTRIEALRQAMRKTLFGLPTPATGELVVKPAPDFVKMGYSRFNPDANDGGWMRYPALKLSSIVPDEWSRVSSVDTSIKASADDAQQKTLSVDLTGTSYSVGGGMNDIALRFADLAIPRGATITGAMLYFYRNNTTGRIPNSVRISVEDVGNSAAYTTALASISGRTWVQEENIASDRPGNDSDRFYFDVVDQVQRGVNKMPAGAVPGWCGGNAMSLRVRAPSAADWSATVFSRDGSNLYGPKLIVSYEISDTTARANSCANMPLDVVVSVRSSLDDAEWTENGTDTSVDYRATSLNPAAVPDSTGRNYVGLRFQDVAVPQGATIEKAWLYVTSSTSSAATASVEVRGFATDNLAAFCAPDAGNNNKVECTAPATTAADLSAASATLTLPGSATSTEGLHRVVEVTPIVQGIINRAGWAPNKALGLLLRNPSADIADGNSNAIYASDSSLSRGAFLHIVYRKQYTNLDLIEKTARQDLYDDIAVRMFAAGGTPLGDAYAEAARYMMGMSPYSKMSFVSSFDEQAPSATYKQPDPRTATTSGTTTTYTSPLVDVGQCSANYVYLMTDGEPNNASNVNNNTKGITDGFNKDCNGYSGYPTTSGNTKANFACMMALGQHMSSGINQKKAVIRTNTVLFDDAISSTDPIVKDMSKTAEWGKGSFFHAKNSAQLTDSLLKTMTSLLDQSGSITAPGVAVNQFNRLTHLDQLYYAVFDPDAKKARWRGNVKRYRLKFTDTTLADGTVQQSSTIVDSKDVNAVDPDTSFFITGSWSWWSTAADGNNAVEGGAASQIPVPSARNLYTHLSGKPASGGTNLTPLNSVTAATGKAAMGLAGDGQFTNARNWLYGYKMDIVQPASGTTPASIKTTAVTPTTSTLLRKELGGVLHSQPVLVNFGFTSATAEEAAQDPSKQDNMVFFSTMEGTLHAVNANTGVETFGFIPKEVMPNVPPLIINDFTSDFLPKFGLDSTWTVLRTDANKDLKINPATTGDQVALFGGMRMGGRTYYGLDVTNRSVPKILWYRYGGATAAEITADSELGKYAKMGYTWSEPVIGDVKINGVAKTVLFIGGGYDPKHENAGFDSTTNASDSMGNQVYIVDPANGNVLWWASNTGASLNSTELKFSIPSKLKTFDANKDGLVDALYFGDLGGQVFRIDLDNGNTGASTLGKRIRRIANLGQGVTADTVNHRRFYEAPSVAIMFDSVQQKEYALVAMGSGYRSHPLNLETEDFFYVMRDDDVLRKDLMTTTTATLQAVIVPSNLATLDLSSINGVDLTGKKGWKIDLPAEGEKVLTSAVILFGEVFFTSYVPSDPHSTDDPDPCQPVLGYTKLWRMSVGDGKVLTDFNGDGSLTAEDRLYSNEAGSVVMGLGGAPQVLVGEDGQNAIITGTGVVRNKDLNSANMRRTRWYEKTKK